MGEFRALLTLSNGSVTMYSDLKRHDDYIATAVDAVVDHSCTEIPTEAFAGFAGLKSVLLPESLEVIHDAAFEGCFNLNKINFPCLC